MADLGDEWFESEESTRKAMVGELKRIRRRTGAHWWWVVLASAVMSFGMWWKLSHKVVMHEAEVVLALSEKSLAENPNHRAIPVDQLREYVLSVLLPAKKLEDMILRRGLMPKTGGKPDKELGLANLWDRTSIEIWKNNFMEYDEGESTLHSARIGVTVADPNPETAMAIARELADIIKDTADAQRQEIADAVADETRAIRDGLEERQADASKLIATKLAALATAQQLGQKGTAAAMQLDVANLYQEQQAIAGKMQNVLGSRASIADKMTEAGLDMSVDVVEEHPPERNEQRGFVLALVMVVIVAGTLFGSALVIGAFDPRVHDLEDVERLALPVLGHVPGFPGDHVGSLAARGAARARVPLSRRWRSHR